MNRHEKSGKDAGEGLPVRNRCWFAARGLEVRRAYGLTIDVREAAALDRILAGCGNTALEPVVCATPSASTSVPGHGSAAGDDALTLLRRQPKRHDYVQGSAPTRYCSGPAFTPGVPLHA